MGFAGLSSLTLAATSVAIYLEAVGIAAACALSCGYTLRDWWRSWRDGP